MDFAQDNRFSLGGQRDELQIDSTMWLPVGTCECNPRNISFKITYIGMTAILSLGYYSRLII
jgi:hypothetical protein